MEPTPAMMPQPNELRLRAAKQPWLQPFASIEEPEPRIAVLLTAPCNGSIATAWAITDSNDSVLESRFAQHFMDECSGTAAALGRAAEELIEDWLSDGVKTYVYADIPHVRQVLKSLRRYLPNLLIMHSPGPRTKRLMYEISDQFVEYRNHLRATLAPTTVATDASVQVGRRGIGVGVIAEDGRYVTQYHRDSSDILVGELRGIEAALSAFYDPALHILSDNTKAVSLARAALDPEVALSPLHRSNKVVHTLREIRHRSLDRRVEIEWVRAHAGHSLNEGADRLAVAVRRAARSKLNEEQRAVIIERIVDDVIAGH